MPLKEKLPNQLFYLAFTTVEDVVGKNGLNSVLNYTGLKKFINNNPPNTLDLEHPTEDFTKFLSGMISVFGENGSRSMMLRSGMRSFQIMLDDFPGLFNLEGVEIKKGASDKLFKEYVRIQHTIIDAAKYIFGDDLYKQYETDDMAVLEISPCYWCMGLETKSPICHGEVGFKLGAARWIFGKDIRIEETHCIAKGDPMCRFVMYRPKD